MPWAAAAAIGSAYIGYQGSQNAAEAASGANAANIAAQQQWNQLVDPFSAGGNRAQYVSQLNQLMQGGYQGLQNDPMYQWMRQQGQDQLQRGLSARGQLGSGNEMIALQQQGTGMAMDFFNQQYARLADLSGASRGGGQAAIGQSPQAAFGQQMAQTQGNMNLFGGALGGLQGIFGSGAGTAQPGQTVVSGGQSYNPSSQYGSFQDQTRNW